MLSSMQRRAIKKVAELIKDPSGRLIKRTNIGKTIRAATCKSLVDNKNQTIAAMVIAVEVCLERAGLSFDGMFGKENVTPWASQHQGYDSLNRAMRLFGIMENIFGLRIRY